VTKTASAMEKCVCGRNKDDCFPSQFSKLKICQHIIAVSDIGGILNSLTIFQFNPT
jgi:hypothetical protein